MFFLTIFHRSIFSGLEIEQHRLSPFKKKSQVMVITLFLKKVGHSNVVAYFLIV